MLKIPLIVKIKFIDRMIIQLFQINREVASVTENKIQNLLSEEDVGPDTKMILVNAVFFKGMVYSLKI